MPKIDRPKSKNIRILRRLGDFLKPYISRVMIAFGALVSVVVATLALGQGIKHLIDNGFSKESGGTLETAISGMLMLAVIMALGTFLRFYMVSWIGERVVADLRRQVYERILSLHSSFFEVTKTGEILSRLNTDTTLLQSVIGSSASMAMRNALNFVGAMIMLLVTNAKLTGVVLLIVPVVVVPIVIYGRKVRALSRASQDRVADVGAYAEESISAIHTVQAFTHEKVDHQRFSFEVENAFLSAVRRIKARSYLTASVILLVFSAIAAVLWVGAQDVMSGKITGGELAAFMFYATIVAFSVGVISEVFGELQRASGATERLFELLDMVPKIKAPDQPLSLPSPLEGRIAFKDVTFSYPSRPDKKTLEHFNLVLNPGEKVALVGPSGAGKTTVMQLLLRFYDIESGDITMDDVPIRHLNPADFRTHIALVPQDPVIFSANAWENIRYGRPDADDQAVLEAAEAAQATEFLRKLPDGFDTFLGEKGTRLSGGQKQRLSIARALLRDPEILLLDEATSALDAHNEQVVQQALDRLMAGRTCLMIAHRLASVMNADRICVMDDGEIKAMGPHDSLLKENALYAKLARLQFSSNVKQ